LGHGYAWPQKNTEIAKTRVEIMRCSLCFFVFFGGKDTFHGAENFKLPERLFVAQPRGGFVVKNSLSSCRFCVPVS